MKIKFQPYKSEDDYWRVRAFLRQALPLYGMRQQVWHVARLDYWRWHVWLNCEDSTDISGALFRWETPEGQIVAVLNPEGRGEAHWNIHPDFRTPELQAEMLEVAEACLATTTVEGKRHLYCFAHSRNPDLAALLEQRGYQLCDSPEHLRRQTLERELPELLPPAGYRVRPLGEVDELPGRSWLSWKAFHVQEPDENYQGWTWYHNIQRQPLYRRDLDWVGVAPNGEQAAFCTIWYDDVTRSGYIEPVGTHPDHQQRGLGKAVMLAALRQLQRLGAVWAYVGSYSPAAHALYESVGFTDFDLLPAYQKEW